MKATIRDHILPYVTICFAIQLGACSSTSNLNREQSPLMTVRVAPLNLSEAEIYNLQAELNSTGLFYAVDRDNAFRAAEVELDLQSSGKVPSHKRYLKSNDIQGAGGILNASQSCTKMMTFLSGSPFFRCTQSLTLIDGSTSMVIHSVTHQADGDLGFQPASWSGITEKFARSIPARFEHVKKPSLQEFEDSLLPPKN